MRVHWLLWLFYWLYWLSTFGLKRRWLAMTLTVTGTPVSRVGRLMCTDSTLANYYYGHWDFQDQAHGHFISFLLGWPHGLTSPVCSKSLNVVWAVLHEMLRFRAIFLNESSIALHCRRLSNEGQLNALFSRHRDRPGVYKFELTAFYHEAHPG